MNFWTKFVAYSLAFVFWILPPFLRWQVGVFLAWLWWDVLKLRRFTVYRNLCIVYPKMSKNDKRVLAKKSMQNLCYNFVDFFLMPLTVPQEIKKNQVTFHGLENWDQAMLQGKGILALSLHMGNGDKGTAMLAVKGLSIQVISKKFKSHFLNQLWFGMREKWGAKFLEPHGRDTSFKILKSLKNKTAVVFVLDQFMSIPYGIETRFFGRKTGTAYGLALFKIKTDAPVLPIYCYRDSERKLHVVIEKELQLTSLSPASKDKQDLLIREWTDLFNAKLESIILQHPEQWMWVHRRWKTWG